MSKCEEQGRKPRAARVIGSLAAVGVVILAAACGSNKPANESAPAATAPAAAPMAAESHAAPGGKAFFVEPKDGASVKSPVHFEFGSEGITISPVPEGTVEKPREGMGHYHLGVDADCKPGAEAIPKGTPSWVHFGKGDKMIDMQLTPGPHKFSVQVADDLHRTIEGFCQTISVTVTP